MLSIKEPAGHESLETTQRYMHLSAAAPRDAIRALEQQVQLGGELGETGTANEVEASASA